MINVSNFLGIYIFQTKTILQHIKHKENDKNFLLKCQNWLVVQLLQYETEKIGVPILKQNIFCISCVFFLASKLYQKPL